MDEKTINFAGRISAVTRDGRSAVVRLEEQADNYGYAVITPETEGRVSLMNGHGVLETGGRVTGTGEPGPEAIRVIEVRAAD